MGQLKSLANDELLAAVSAIVRRGNEITAEFLEHLVELDERRLHLDLGFASLFEYCVEALGLCESTAWRQVAVARVCRSYPEALQKIAHGELHVSALSLMAKHLNRENAAELLDACSRMSTRKVEELLAARFPKPDVRESVRRLPAQPGLTLNVESGPEAVRAEASCEPAKAEKPRRIEPLSPDRYGVHFTADGEFLARLERVRALARHRLPSGDLMTLMKRGLEAYERELEKERFAVGRKPRARNPKAEHAKVEHAKSDPLKQVPRRTRHVPAAVAREVYVRDGRQCTFVSEDGRRCAARTFVELDHIEPWAVGGADTVANLRLRCRAHNQLAARRYFGSAKVDGAVRRAPNRSP